MSEIPKDLRFTREHEWVRAEDDGTLTVGITDHAQAELGDLVFAEVPEAGTSFGVGDAVAVVESVKAASDIYCPVAGEIVQSNSGLDDAPELINNDPYGEGWIFQVRPENSDDLADLLDADAYNEFVESTDND